MYVVSILHYGAIAFTVNRDRVAQSNCVPAISTVGRCPGQEHRRVMPHSRDGQSSHLHHISPTHLIHLVFFCIFVPGEPSVLCGRTPLLPSRMPPSASGGATACPGLTFKRSTSCTNAGPLASKPPTNQRLFLKSYYMQNEMILNVF